jgi:hypothetical protein
VLFIIQSDTWRHRAWHLGRELTVVSELNTDYLDRERHVVRILKNSTRRRVNRAIIYSCLNQNSLKS